MSSKKDAKRDDLKISKSLQDASKKMQAKTNFSH
jgi:hypothetical protein